MIDWSQKKTIKNIADKQREQIKEDNNRIALTFLKDTDWYVIREHDTGKIIPKNIEEQRNKARNSITNIQT